MGTHRRWIDRVAPGNLALRAIGVVGWGVCFALLWCGPLSRAAEPYFSWGSVVSGIWHGCGLASIGSAIFAVPPMIVILIVHGTARRGDRRRGRTPRDAGPLTVFLISSWLYVPVLLPLAIASCVSHGLDEKMDAPWLVPQSPTPVWASMMNFSILAHPAAQAILSAFCLVSSFVMAAKTPIHASIAESLACARCGYSRVGLTENMGCPECGSEPPRAGRVPPKPAWVFKCVRWSMIGILALLAAVLASVEIGLGERSVWVYRLVRGSSYWLDVHPLEPALGFVLVALTMFGLAWPVRGVRKYLLLLAKLHAISFLVVVILAAVAHFVFVAGNGTTRFHRNQFEFFEVCGWLLIWTAGTSVWFVHGLRRWKEDAHTIVGADASGRVITL